MGTGFLPTMTIQPIETKRWIFFGIFCNLVLQVDRNMPKIMITYEHALKDNLKQAPPRAPRLVAVHCHILLIKTRAANGKQLCQDLC